MFAVVPLDFRLKAPNRTLPAANLGLIAANVLMYVLARLFGWCWVVGPGTSLLSVLLYGFSHWGFWHLLLNMWVLWVFGNPVNRRLGNGYYLLAYLGTIIGLGLFARICYGGSVLGASGGIFAVIMIALILMPSAILWIGYVAVFPLTLLIGLLRKPRYGIYWFVRGGELELKAVWCLLLIPLMEAFSLFCSYWSGFGNVFYLGHLLGMLCGVAIVLMLPTRITMGRRAAAKSV